MRGGEQIAHHRSVGVALGLRRPDHRFHPVEGGEEGEDGGRVRGGDEVPVLFAWRSVNDLANVVGGESKDWQIKRLGPDEASLTVTVGCGARCPWSRRRSFGQFAQALAGGGGHLRLRSMNVRRWNS